VKTSVDFFSLASCAPASLAQTFIDSNGSANCKMKKNNKEAFMSEFLWDVNEYNEF
jgi:hypothetical protein